MANTRGAQTVCGAPSCHRRAKPLTGGLWKPSYGLGRVRTAAETRGTPRAGSGARHRDPSFTRAQTPPGRGLSSAGPDRERVPPWPPAAAEGAPEGLLGLPASPRRLSHAGGAALIPNASSPAAAGAARPCLPPSLRRRGNAGDPRTGSGSSAPPLLHQGAPLAVRNEPEPAGLSGHIAPRRDGRTHRHSRRRRPARCPAVLPPLRAPPRLCRAELCSAPLSPAPPGHCPRPGPPRRALPPPLRSALWGLWSRRVDYEPQGPARGSGQRLVCGNTADLPPPPPPPPAPRGRFRRGGGGEAPREQRGLGGPGQASPRLCPPWELSSQGSCSGLGCPIKLLTELDNRYHKFFKYSCTTRKKKRHFSE